MYVILFYFTVVRVSYNILYVTYYLYCHIHTHTNDIERLPLIIFAFRHVVVLEKRIIPDIATELLYNTCAGLKSTNTHILHLNAYTYLLHAIHIFIWERFLYCKHLSCRVFIQTNPYTINAYVLCIIYITRLLELCVKARKASKLTLHLELKFVFFIPCWLLLHFQSSWVF